MSGRFAGPFSLFRDANTKERLVKNYATKLLALVERQMELSGTKFRKYVSSHNGVLYTVSINKSGPLPIRKVHVQALPLTVPVGVEEEKTSALYFIMETGLLIWSEAVPDFPISIVVNPAIETYFDLFPGDNLAKTHLDVDPITRSFVWNQELPVITSGEYTSELWTVESPPVDTAIYKPELFTGLMRLLVQAKVGARLDFQPLMPDGWGFPNGDQHGLIIDPGGDYWLCWITSDFCRAWPLTKSALIMEALAQATVPSPGLGESVHKAWELASLQAQIYDPETEPSPEVVLWEQGEVLPGWPLAYGWHFDNAGSQAVEVRVEATIVNATENWYTGRLYTFTFGFSEDAGVYTPTGSIALTDEGDFVPTDGYSSIWVPEYDGYVLWHAAIWDETPFAGEVSPIYAFFDNDDALQVIKYTTFEVVEETGLTSEYTGSFKGCTHDKQWTAGGITYSTSTRTGGISINGEDPPFEMVSTDGALETHYLTSQTADSTEVVWDVRRSFDYYSRFAHTMPTYTTVFGEPSVISFGAGIIEGTCTPCRPGDFSDEIAPFLPRPDLPDNGYSWARWLRGDVKYRTVEKKVETADTDEEYARQALFICATDAEAIIWNTVKRKTVVSDVSRNYNAKFETEVHWQAVWVEYDSGTGVWTGNRQYEHEDTYPLYWLGDFDNQDVYPGVWGCSSTVSTGATDEGLTSWYSSPNNYGYYLVEEEQITETAQAEFVGRERFDLPSEFDNWYDATTDNIVTDNTRADSWARAMQAWSAGEIVRSGANAEMTATEGWPERLVSTQRFIGGA